ncbi:unnamed protein product [Urochloa decumbens]|uniref:Cytochrome P450 n=1 Tax=Urochloa decumbens TaxID=240449 RepID=A0ABC9AL34_9POAL
MEPFSLPYFYYGLCILLPIIFHAILSRGKAGRRLPPGPWQLPVIGSLHHLVGGLPHRVMRDLSLRHGPLMQLRICERVAFVVSSAEIAREIFKGHGTAFEQRPTVSIIDDMYSEHGMSVMFSPYGEHWRQLRRILVSELLGARRVEAFRRIREEEAARLVSSLASSPPGQVANVSELLAEFVADSAVRAIYGDKLPNRDVYLKTRETGTDFSAIFDLRDLFPSSRLLRMLPRNKKGQRHFQEVSRIIDEILRHREERSAAGDGGGEQDMISVLLRMQKESSSVPAVSLTPGIIKSVVTEMFGGALDTTTATLQWAMAELIANPRAMEKAQLEIRRVLAGQERVQEAALGDMHYLKAVIKETLRMHPPTALVSRLCLQHGQKVQGYDVPHGTVIMTNVWAISRDPKYWRDPDSFMPERFEGEGALDFGGSDFNFTPFGSGRRVCPGIDFSEANIQIALASLLYHFDWELPPSVKEEGIDMTESFGVTAKRKAELLLLPIPRIPVV